MSARPGRSVLLALGLLWQLGVGASAALGAGNPPVPAGGAESADAAALASTRSVLLLHMSPRMSPALLALDQAFRATLKGAVAEPLSIYAEYLELTAFDDESLQRELARYLGAKYAGTKVDLIAVTSSRGLRFVERHRARLFPGTRVVFGAVDRRAAAAVALREDVSGVWLSMDWAGTLDAALKLHPETEHAVVVTGASGVDQVWAAEARAQLEPFRRAIAITYLDGLPIETVLQRVAALPGRTVVLLGAYLRDGAGRDLRGPEDGARIAAASAVPVYTLIESTLGSGVVGGHVVSFEAQGRRLAELVAKVLRGERPPATEAATNVYRFDARQLRRWGLDARRLPPDSVVLFDEPSVWEAYRGYIVGAVLLLALQTWLIIGLLASRAQRRRAQVALAEQLRFETLVSNVLATLITPPRSGVDMQVERALALIGADLDVDRVVLAERNDDKHSVEVTHAWTREGIPAMPASVAWSGFPWVARRVGEGHVVVVSPRHPLPPEALVDDYSMLERGTGALLAVPLVVDGAVIGVLSCATIRRAREWPDERIERLRLLAEVLANTLARRRAETAARESEERFRRQREELAHALRVNTLGELSASLAHEINQPLTAIVMNARAMSRLLQRGPTDEAAVAEVLTDIAADGSRAGAIIRRLRALSRKEHAPQRGLDLNALVDEVAGLLHQDFVRKGVTVRRVTAPDVPSLSGDPIQLQQIFLNLLVNASEALGGVDRSNREIVITTSHPAPDLVEVTIRDNGVGAKDLDVERIFERFVTTKPGGLGMGLAISRSIVEAHGGRIYAKVNAEGGLTVHVELPSEGPPASREGVMPTARSGAA